MRYQRRADPGRYSTDPDPGPDEILNLFDKKKPDICPSFSRYSRNQPKKPDPQHSAQPPSKPTKKCTALNSLKKVSNSSSNQIVIKSYKI